MPDTSPKVVITITEDADGDLNISCEMDPPWRGLDTDDNSSVHLVGMAAMKFIARLGEDAGDTVDVVVTPPEVER